MYRRQGLSPPKCRVLNKNYDDTITAADDEEKRQVWSGEIHWFGKCERSCQGVSEYVNTRLHTWECTQSTRKEGSASSIIMKTKFSKSRTKRVIT